MNITYKVGLVALTALGAGVLYLKRSSLFGNTEASLRGKVVQAAISQLGRSDSTPYWMNVLGTPSKLSWCGAFALWALHQAGLALNKNWIPGKGFILTWPNPLPATHTPKPGDIAFFTSYQHQAVVSAVYPDGTVGLVNGNGANGTVSPSRTLASNVTAFYSIQPFINQALSAKAA